MKEEKKDTKDTRLMRYAIEQKKKKDKRKERKEKQLYTSLGKKNTILDKWLIHLSDTRRPFELLEPDVFRLVKFIEKLNRNELSFRFTYHNIPPLPPPHLHRTGRRKNRNFFKHMNMTFTCILCKFTLVLANINNLVAGIWN